MAWVIQSASEGPVLINDLGLTLHKNQMKDLDLLGRENAERSNDLKSLLSMNPPKIRTIKKDPYTPPGGIDPQIVKELTETTIQAKAVIETQASTIKELRQEAEVAKEQTKVMMSKMEELMASVKQLADEHPKEIRTMRKAIENIQVERADIATKREEIKSSDSMTDEEIKMQDKILSMRDKKLEKNYKDLGKTITKTEDVSMDDTLEVMDQLGI